MTDLISTIASSAPIILPLGGGFFGWVAISIIYQGKKLRDHRGEMILLTKTAADIKELLDITRKEMAEIREAQKGFSRVMHEHDMVKAAGNIIASHGYSSQPQKKTIRGGSKSKKVRKSPSNSNRTSESVRG